MSNMKITVIGCGKMGSAIFSSIRKNGKYEVSGVEKDESRLKELAGADFHVNKELKNMDESDLYVIAVKPQVIDEALKELGEHIKGYSRDVAVVSVAAGVKIKFIKDYLEKYKQGISVIRIMPNTPALVGAGMSAIAVGDDTDKSKVDAVRDIFESLGSTALVSEETIDAVTAVSGSGPAYFFYMAEVMEQFALDNKIDVDTARRLSAQTVLGAGKLMMESCKSFTDLRNDVTSPGGTTQAALEHLMDESFGRIFYDAMEKAKKRSKELAEGK
jgi:pyrroline-5-carboxylate reductase